MIDRPSGSRRSRLLILLLVPFIVLLYPPFYNVQQPEFLAIPFFYWFQLLWIFITAAITAIVYFRGA